MDTIIESLRSHASLDPNSEPYEESGHFKPIVGKEEEDGFVQSIQKIKELKNTIATYATESSDKNSKSLDDVKNSLSDENDLVDNLIVSSKPPNMNEFAIESRDGNSHFLKSDIPVKTSISDNDPHRIMQKLKLFTRSVANYARECQRNQNQANLTNIYQCIGSITEALKTISPYQFQEHNKRVRESLLKLTEKIGRIRDHLIDKLVKEREGYYYVDGNLKGDFPYLVKRDLPEEIIKSLPSEIMNMIPDDLGDKIAITYSSRLNDFFAKESGYIGRALNSHMKESLSRVLRMPDVSPFFVREINDYYNHRNIDKLVKNIILLREKVEDRYRTDLLYRDYFDNYHSSDFVRSSELYFFETLDYLEVPELKIEFLIALLDFLRGKIKSRDDFIKDNEAIILFDDYVEKLLLPVINDRGLSGVAEQRIKQIEPIINRWIDRGLEMEPREALRRIEQLKDLPIKYFKISKAKFQKEILKNLPCLECLSFTCPIENEIWQTLCNEGQTFSNLKELITNIRCGWDTWPPKILENIEKFTFWQRKLGVEYRNWNDFLPKMKNLKNLVLHCDINTSMCNAIYILGKMEYLSLTWRTTTNTNTIVSFVNELKRMTNMKEVNICNCPLNVFENTNCLKKIYKGRNGCKITFQGMTLEREDITVPV